MREGIARHRPAGFHWDEKVRVKLPDGAKSCRWCKGPVGPGRKTFCGTGKAPFCPRCGFFPDPVPGRPIAEHPHLIGEANPFGFTSRRWRPSCPTCKGLLASNGEPVEPCVHAWRLRTDTAYYSGLVWLRDGGICALCREDCGTGGRKWEADHAVPLIEGGSYELDNLRTLCVPCHRAETKALAGRRAQARRLANEAAGMPLLGGQDG